MFTKEEIEEITLLIEDHLELLHENHVDDNFDDMYENSLKLLHSIQKKIRMIEQKSN